MFQSTHPCGVRPGSIIQRCTSTPVSIHAPLRGATSIRLACPTLYPRFQSTHPCGVRPDLRWSF